MSVSDTVTPLAFAASLSSSLSISVAKLDCTAAPRVLPVSCPVEVEVSRTTAALSSETEIRALPTVAAAPGCIGLHATRHPPARHAARAAAARADPMGGAFQGRDTALSVLDAARRVRAATGH